MCIALHAAHTDGEHIPAPAPAPTCGAVEQARAFAALGVHLHGIADGLARRLPLSEATRWAKPMALMRLGCVQMMFTRAPSPRAIASSRRN